MFRYSSHILICFIAYNFKFPKSFVGEVALCNCGMGLLSSTIVIVIRMRLHQKTIKPPSIPRWEVKHWCSYWKIVMELAKLTDKIHKHVEIIHPRIKKRGCLFVSVNTTFHSSFQLDASSLSATRSQQHISWSSLNYWQIYLLTRIDYFIHISHKN